ncbi:hypothetical protein VTK56DRAFT_8896 [Thermocarpiscus australiensis]
MLSHLRFHRRAPSNPPSPLPDQAPHTLETAAHHDQPRPARDVSPRSNVRPESPASSDIPPTLPPIARVTSTGSDHSFSIGDVAPHVSQDSRMPLPRPAHEEDKSTGFIGGVALEKYRRASQGLPLPDSMTAMSTQLPENQLSRTKPAPPPINTSLAARPAMSAGKQAKSSSFVTPTDLQHASAATISKRPSGARLRSEPTPHSASGSAPESQKSRKGLPFLKNPVSSLLMRRKTGHSAAEAESPAPSYDPRIRGTKVHDFSAPRPKKAISTTDATSALKLEVPPAARKSAEPGEPPAPSLLANLDEHIPVEPTQPPVQRMTHVGADGDSKPGTQGGTGQSSDSPLSDVNQPPVPPKDESTPSLCTSTSAASRATSITPSNPIASASVKTNASRKLSILETTRRNSVASAVPKHMKSTSSRFSFDMIGAAKQEKLLEERHRQREQERKTSDDTRFSKFDDFDDESFDYDAMMDDDSLEEKIPGINADLDDEEELEAAMDPDNDQENFAGFAFQRSNPASSLASQRAPAVLATPRDAKGQVIGFATTKDKTSEIPTSESPVFPNRPKLPKSDEEVVGLGSQGLNTDPGASAGTVFSPAHPTATTGLDPPVRAYNDDLYFDDGLADELDFEHDGTAFDETIFDINDTDQFGRPIPGAFAQAQEAMRAAQQQLPSNRDSDMTSSVSGQSGITHSTGHAPLGAGLQRPADEQEKELEYRSSPKQPSADPMQMLDIPGQDLAYQAALAEAAQKAAASGKFRRSSSPSEVSPLAVTSPTGPSETPSRTVYPDDYDDDGFANDFDDFDFDDEAIIAEANASALANDSDGFYGQEFGFYSAPIPQPQYGHGHQGASSSARGDAEGIFQYANGGYFGPAGAGLNRSTSGRVACREPNLTPITERSEYSNRNSIMSFTLPPAIGSSSEGRNSASLASPGLAQLALLPADDDSNMNLPALLKLRSRAWGGSQASLASSREGSPRSERAPAPLPDGAASPYALGSAPPTACVTGGTAGHARANSGVSLWSSSEAGSGAASPTLTNGAALPVGSSLPLASSSPGAVPPLAGGGSGGTNGVVSPLPLFSPGMAAATSASSPSQVPGGSACSPVLEGEEGNIIADRSGNGTASVLAPALPLRTRSPVRMLNGGG